MSIYSDLESRATALVDFCTIPTKEPQMVRPLKHTLLTKLEQLVFYVLSCWKPFSSNYEVVVRQNIKKNCLYDDEIKQW